MNTQPDTTIPSRLQTPPVSQVNPPVETKLQELPFGELTWENFEKLCLRLARLEADVEHCQLYGERGQEQEGIDLYARKKSAEKYTVYQCKRVSKFGPAKIKDAVSKFLEGEWAGKTDGFVLCTQESLVSNQRADELEIQSRLLQAKGITLIVWDSHQLSTKLKTHPELADDFFGREWAKEFCGEAEAAKLRNRLDTIKVVEFRQKLGAFYRRVFNTHDPGLPIARFGEPNSLALEDRFIVPDVVERHNLTLPYSTEATDSSVPLDENPDNAFSTTAFQTRHQTHRSRRSSYEYQQRQGVEKWLAEADRSLILGGPGSGKSTLLRFLAIDLLQDSPRLTRLAQKWGLYLPVWVPFALWTKIISDSSTEACSLSQFLQNWLNRWDEQRLWPLVEKALEDDRLLLLVDGLDEWTNESAAKIALDRLQVFIGQRNVSAIMTSRPRGFERLGMQGTNWQRGHLSDFSSDQQRELSRIWFSYKMRSLYQDTADSEHEIERKADVETESFLAELHRAPDLRELGKVPLLLSLFIFHRFHNTRLPRNRFKAYDSLIEHLISTHPQRRKTAAGLPEILSELDEDEIKTILAHLAYHLQSHSAQGPIDHNDAITLVDNYLQEGHDFGFEPREARRHSREVLEVGEGSMGLLVRQSPKEIGFFHRVFQEYLSAYYLSRMPFDKQLSVVQRSCVDAQWHEVILGLFHFTRRAEEMKQFVDCIKEKRVNRFERFSVDLLLVDLLLSETAFGEFKCSVGLARELAKETFEQIELGSWMPHRERLLQHVLDGLRSTKVRELVKAKLRSWFPCRVRWPWGENIFNAMANWPRSAEVAECLWRGIHDEDTNNQRAAARALADLADSDSETGNRVASLAWNAVNPQTRVTAIEALLRGWPDHGDIERILNAVRHSMSPELRLIAIIGRIHQQRQTDEDRQELIHLGSAESRLDYCWRRDVALAIMNGWPKSPRIKALCFDTLREPVYQKLDREIALRILLGGYPGDDDVADYCVGEITNGDYPFVLLHGDAWQLLSENFRDHPRMVAAIDEWIVKQEHRQPQIAMAAMVGRTQTVKAKLLSLLNSSNPHWPAGSLIEDWGMQDAEVAEIMMEIATGPVREASEIAHLLPQIVTDKTTCRSRLLEILRDPACVRPDFVMVGLEALGDTQGDSEVVDVLLNFVPKFDDLFHRDVVIGRLILNYSSDQRVKKLAKRELSEREGSYGTVAWAYGEDEEMRQKILEIACPLPAQLRGAIASYLGTEGGDETFAMSLLQLYDHETDDAVKTQASISYHERLKASGQNINPTLGTLSQSIVCYGHDYEDRRRAAFCGLVTLGRLDLMVNAKERGEDRLCAISTINWFSPNVPILRHILQNWEEIKTAFGDEFWDRLSESSSNPSDIWDAFCMFADEYPACHAEAVGFLDDGTKWGIKANELRFLGRVRPKSRLLLEYCLNALRIRDDSHDSSGGLPALVAAELLGEYFADDPDVLTQIMSRCTDQHIPDEVIIALCEGWPESDELARIFEMASKRKVEVTHPAYFQLICRKSTSGLVFQVLTEGLSHSERSYERQLQDLTRPIIRRLRTDDSLLSMLNGQLQNNPTPSEKATIPRLIAGARGVQDALRTWCIEEVDRQLSGIESPEVGFDLIASELRPVAHTLLDVVYQLNWQSQDSNSMQYDLIEDGISHAALIL